MLCRGRSLCYPCALIRSVDTHKNERLPTIYHAKLAQSEYTNKSTAWNFWLNCMISFGLDVSTFTSIDSTTDSTAVCVDFSCRFLWVGGEISVTLLMKLLGTATSGPNSPWEADVGLAAFFSLLRIVINGGSLVKVKNNLTNLRRRNYILMPCQNWSAYSFVITQHVSFL